MIIAFPPCTYLSNAGVRWFNEDRYGDAARARKDMRLAAMEFVLSINYSDCARIAIENPVGYLNSHWRKPDQIIQPYQFGDPERKRTCLWLKNLPLLKPTNIVEPKMYGRLQTGTRKGKPIYFSDTHPGENDSISRSKTFLGIAKAMAAQWTNISGQQKKLF